MGVGEMFPILVVITAYVGEINLEYVKEEHLSFIEITGCMWSNLKFCVG